MESETKPCRACGVVLPLLDYPIRGDQKDGHHWWCLDCKRAKDREYGRVWRAAHPDEKRRNGRKYARRAEVRASRSAQTLRQKYGLTPESFAAKLEAQGGKCPFCAADDDEPKNWDIDHDHRCCSKSVTCGKCLRDILCHKHNQALGYWNDDPELLRAAADYIELWRRTLGT